MAERTLWNTVWDSLLCMALALFTAYIATDPNIEPVPKAAALLVTATPLVPFGALWRFRVEDINLSFQSFLIASRLAVMVLV